MKFIDSLTSEEMKETAEFSDRYFERKSFLNNLQKLASQENTNKESSKTSEATAPSKTKVYGNTR